MKKPFLWGCAAAVAASATFPAWADTHTVAAGETETLSNVTETSRFVKNGDGTLVLGGDNSFKRVTMSAGELKISGGTTSISDEHGSGASDANNIFAMSSGNLTVKDGATLTMSTTDGAGYAIQHGGTLLVTNGTMDVSGVGEYLNGFEDNGSFAESRVVIADGGVVRAKRFRPSGATSSSLKEMASLDLNVGGKLYLEHFFGDTNIRYGRINFNGGVVYPLVAGSTTGTRLFRYEESAKTWTEGGVVPTVREGGMYIHTVSNNTISVSIQSGAEKDGGFHHSGKAVIYWHAKNSTFNGGTWLESDNGAVLALNAASGDSTLGALPSSPATNIWVTGANHVLFSDGNEMAIHPNRMLFVKHGKRLYLGTQGRLVIGGEIHGEIPENQTAPTGTAVHVRNEGGWNGTVVLNPGAGHTNDIGRLIDYGRLEITSGVTRVTAAVDNGTDEAKALVFVSGNNSAYASYRGELCVNGGTLTCSQAARYVIARQYAQVEVTNGGRIDMPKLTYVNGLSSPATLTIADGGTMCVTNLQIANGTTAVVNLNRGGTLIASRFWSSATSYGIFNFDGGCLQSSNAGELLFGLNDGASRWVNARVYVKEGGAVFATPTQHLWIRLPLLSGVAEGEKDGGLTYFGSDNKALVMSTNNFYNGATVVAGGTLQMRVDNAVLPGSTLVMSNGAWLSLCMYDKKVNGSYATSTQTEQWLGRLEGDGNINYCSNLHVTNALAPSACGTVNGCGRLAFYYPCDLRGDFEIRGDMEHCGYILAASSGNFVIDISHLKLKMIDAEAMDSHAKSNVYKILDAPNGYTGEFQLAADWPMNWAVKYSADGKSAYVYHQNGTQIIFR